MSDQPTRTKKPFDMPPVGAGFDVRGGWLIGRLLDDLAPPFNAIHAAGIVGNLGGESGLRPDVNEVSPTVPGSRGGFGWEQATGVRRRALEADALQHGLDVGSDEENYDFLLDELASTEHRALVGLENTQTVEDAVRVFEVLFERPSDPEGGLRSRVAFAKRAMASYLLHQGAQPLEAPPPVRPEPVWPEAPQAAPAPTQPAFGRRTFPEEQTERPDPETERLNRTQGEPA